MRRHINNEAMLWHAGSQCFPVNDDGKHVITVSRIKKIYFANNRLINEVYKPLTLHQTTNFKSGRNPKHLQTTW